MDLKIVVSSLSCILALFCGLSEGDFVPPKCCSPDQWEANVINVGTTYRQGYYFNNMDVNMAYDYTNDRWAIDQIHPDDSSLNLKLVFNHFENKRYAINSQGCYKMDLNAPLNKYCIPANSTFLGYHTTGSGDNTLTYSSWSYDLFFFPLRISLAVSQKLCLPIKEVTFGLVQNTWSWEEGDPACNPWEDPEVVIQGECYKSYRVNYKELVGTTPTSPMVNMDYTNLNLTISNEALFQVPENCIEKDWAENVRFNDFWRLLIMRMKFYDYDVEVGSTF